MRVLKDPEEKNSEDLVPETSPLTEGKKQFLKEYQELRDANEILKDALGFFAKGMTGNREKRKNKVHQETEGPVR